MERTSNVGTGLMWTHRLLRLAVATRLAMPIRPAHTESANMGWAPNQSLTCFTLGTTTP
ncbi:hypothetical protein FAM22021_000067 [Propionibacterium freudenreichii]|nr:hypothetical protein [Propionibacterium freudenreichii]